MDRTVPDPGRNTIRLSAVLAGALLIAFVLWLALNNDDDSTPSTNPGAQQGGPTTTLSEKGLIELARSLGRRVYWVGPRRDIRYELTTTAGRTFVRYLPAGAQPGDPRTDFLTVATYPMAEPLAALRRAGREGDTQTIELPRGAMALTSPTTPTSAYYSRPGLRAQIEVYHPTAGEAISLVLAGQVRQVD